MTDKLSWIFPLKRASAVDRKLKQLEDDDLTRQ